MSQYGTIGNRDAKTSSMVLDDKTGNSFMASDLSRVAVKPEDVVAESFRRFKSRLSQANEKWYHSRNIKTRPSVMQVP